MKFILLPAFLVVAASLLGSAAGQVSSVTFTIATADRVPFATSKAITVAFTTATALSNGGRITVNYPAGFFASCVQPVVTGHPVIASSTETGVSSFVLTVNGTLAAAATTVTLVGLTMGGPTANSASGITVSTSLDAVSGGAASGTIGGQVASVGMTIADANRAAGATAKPVTFVFTTTVALASGDKITISYPSGFFAPAITPTVTAATTGHTAGATGATSITLTAGSAIAAAAITMTLTGMTLGAATASADATGIKVSTVKDLISSGSTTGVIGQVTNVALTFAAGDRIAATTKDVTIAFTIPVALVATDKVTINYPNAFFGTTASTPSAIKTSTTGGLASTLFQADTNAPGATSLTIVVMTGQTPSGAHTLVLIGMTTGTVTSGDAKGISVSAPGNAVSAGQDSGYLSAVYAVSMTAITSPTVDGASKEVVFTFTPTVALAADAGGLITIFYPENYFAASVVPSVAGASTDTGAFERILSTTAFGATSYVFKLIATKACAANVAATVTLSGVKLAAAPVLSSATGFKVQATGNAISRGSPIGAIGVAVTVVSSNILTIAAVDRAAGATGKAATFAFTTTVELVAQDKITINYPGSFFAAGVTPTVAPATLTAGATGANSIILTAGSTIAPAALAITLSGLTLGGAVGTSNAITVVTDKNPILSATAASGAIGQVTSVTFLIASGDRTPGATSKAVTIGFTLGVALAVADKITVNYPSGFLTGTPTSITSGGNAVSTDFEAAGAAGATSITIAVKSGGSAGATGFTITVNGMTIGAAPTAANTTGISVSAPGNAVSAGQDTGAIGGAVTAVSFYSPDVRSAGAANRTVTVTFTTASATPATTGKITISYPSGYFATSPTPVVYFPTTIASAAAPTATAIVLTVGSTAISAGAITVILGGLTMGAAASCSATGITVSTSADYATSVSLASTLVSSSGADAGPNAAKNNASLLYISASFVLAFVFAVLA